MDHKEWSDLSNLKVNTAGWNNCRSEQECIRFSDKVKNIIKKPSHARDGSFLLIL